MKTPQVYFTLNQSGYAVVDSSKEQEVDYLNKGGSVSSSSYTGTGGVALNSWVKRAAFALRFGDWNPIISSYVTPGSKILYVRDVQQRVQAVAPFLSWDSDPYPVVVDGKIEYIIDGYTTTNHYPNAQTADTTNLSNYGLGGKSFNYARNSVKAVVDTYNGNVTIYVVDKTDPIIKAYVSAFPKLFDLGSVPPSLKDHFRYPEDLFTVQTNMWGRYHITDPQSFYSQTAGWSVAQDPGHDVQNPQQGTTTNQQGQTSTVKEQRVNPYYAIMKLPGDQDASFKLFRTFVPFSQDDSKKTLTAFMTAESDSFDGNYGQLTVYQIPSDVLPDGPGHRRVEHLVELGRVRADLAAEPARFDGHVGQPHRLPGRPVDHLCAAPLRGRGRWHAGAAGAGRRRGVRLGQQRDDRDQADPATGAGRRCSPTRRPRRSTTSGCRSGRVRRRRATAAAPATTRPPRPRRRDRARPPRPRHPGRPTRACRTT